MAPKPTEALVTTNQQQILEALNNTEKMEALAAQAKAITVSLITDGEFDIEDKKDRMSVKRIGRRVGRTAKDINDCGVAYLRDTKAAIKEVEKRKKWFGDQLAEVRASVEAPVKEWEGIRTAVDETMEIIQSMTRSLTGEETSKQLQALLDTVSATSLEVVPDKLDELALCVSTAAETITTRVAIATKQEVDAKELERLREQTQKDQNALAKQQADELDRLKKENEALRSGTIVPVAEPEQAPEPVAEPEPTPSADQSPEAPCASCVVLKALVRDMHEVVTVGDAAAWANNWEIFRNRMTELKVY